jgi:cold shock CspA family protein/arsenate reductase-like glutaredoxin family protein
MIKGTVKFFNNAKGFGFITPDDGGKDVFVPAATITQSGSGRLKAGQRVSFETEPDPKGPKAVRLTLLDEPLREVVREMPRETSRDVPKDISRDAAPLRDTRPAPRPAVTLYHDPADDESADILEALRDAGHEPRLVDVTLTPPSRDELKRLSLLLREADQSLVRRYDPLFLELQLDDRFISESEFWQGVAEHPQLINAPVIATANKARLARNVHDVQSFLGQDVAPASKPKGLSARMTAMMNGHPVPPPPPKEVKEVKKAEKVEAPKPVLKIASEPEAKPKKTPAAAKPVKAAAKPVAKPAAKPVKAVKKAVAKPAAKKAAAPAKKAAKKK